MAPATSRSAASGRAAAEPAAARACCPRCLDATPMWDGWREQFFFLGPNDAKQATVNPLHPDLKAIVAPTREWFVNANG